MPPRCWGGAFSSLECAEALSGAGTMPPVETSRLYGAELLDAWGSSLPDGMVCIVSSGDEERSEGTWTRLRPLGVAGVWGRWLLASDEFLERECDGGGEASPSLLVLGGIGHLCAVHARRMQREACRKISLLATGTRWKSRVDEHTSAAQR